MQRDDSEKKIEEFIGLTGISRNDVQKIIDKASVDVNKLKVNEKKLDDFTLNAVKNSKKSVKKTVADRLEKVSTAVKEGQSFSEAIKSVIKDDEANIKAANSKLKAADTSLTSKDSLKETSKFGVSQRKIMIKSLQKIDKNFRKSVSPEHAQNYLQQLENTFDQAKADRLLSKVSVFSLESYGDKDHTGNRFQIKDKDSIGNALHKMVDSANELYDYAQKFPEETQKQVLMAKDSLHNQIATFQKMSYENTVQYNMKSDDYQQLKELDVKFHNYCEHNISNSNVRELKEMPSPKQNKLQVTEIKARSLSELSSDDSNALNNMSQLKTRIQEAKNNQPDNSPEPNKPAMNHEPPSMLKK